MIFEEEDHANNEECQSEKGKEFEFERPWREYRRSDPAYECENEGFYAGYPGEETVYHS